LLLTIDTMVEAIHFDLALIGPADAGWRALTAAVSDIGAMGGVPGRCLVSVAAPSGARLEELAEGTAAAAARWRCPVVGGDLTGADRLVVTVAVTGWLEGPAGPVTRAGARPGDRIVVTGPLGGAAAALRRLRAGERLSEEAAAPYRRPLARLAEGAAARASGATAMMDLSDGLGLDLHRLAASSGVGVAVEEVPAAPGATADEAVGGGDDYELVLTTPDPEALFEGYEAAGLRSPIVIGRCTEDPAERRLGRSGTLSPAGYEHRF
jgi:thiamine-monophosphate kinase